jgi:hypothetical protein
MSHFTRLQERVSVAFTVWCLVLSVARGQEREPPGKELHPSYVLYYAPGDGTVQVVDPRTGAVGEPIYASTQEGLVVRVYWFAYDWPGKTMYVIYGDNVGGTLLLGTAALHSWKITPINTISVPSYFYLADMHGLAYSQKTGLLYMQGEGGCGYELFKLDPLTAAVIGFYGDCADSGQAVSNDPDGNVWYALVTQASGYEKVILVSPDKPSGPFPSPDALSAFLVRWNPGNPLADDGLAPWQPLGPDSLLALAIHPEDGSIYGIMPPSFGVLNVFSTPFYQTTVAAITMQRVNQADFVTAGDNVAKSLVFVPWEPPSDD